MTRRNDSTGPALLGRIGPTVDPRDMDAADLGDHGVASAPLDDIGSDVRHCDKLRSSQHHVKAIASENRYPSPLRYAQTDGMDAPPFSPAWLSAMFVKHGKKPAELVAFAAERGVSLDASKISKSMSEKRPRAIQEKERPVIWEFFGLPAGEFPAAVPFNIVREPTVEQKYQTPLPNAGLQERLKFDRSSMPILGHGLGSGPNKRLLFNGEILGRIDRPARLADVPDAYGCYVHGTSMEPRYEAGEVVLVNPQKPVRKGNYVVAQVYDNDQDPPYGYVKKLVAYTNAELVLEQLNPEEGEDRIMRFPRNRVLSVHRIVGTLDE